MPRPRHPGRSWVLFSRTARVAAGLALAAWAASGHDGLTASASVCGPRLQDEPPASAVGAAGTAGTVGAIGAAGGAVRQIPLSFLTAEERERWRLRGEGYEVELTAPGPGTEPAGLHLALRAGALPTGAAAGVAMLRFPVDSARGTHLRLAGSMRSADIRQGWAGLWARVDGKDHVLALDNMAERGVAGTTPWSPVEAEVDVPAEATRIALGALLTGDGSAWVKDLTVSLEPAWQAVEGRVEGPAGAPVAGALVAVERGIPVEAKVLKTGSDGRFHTVIPAGRFGLTATSGELEATAVPADQVRRMVGGGLVLRLQGGGVELLGTLRAAGKLPAAGTRVRLTLPTPDGGNLFYAETDGAGTFGARLPPGTYQVALDGTEDELQPATVRLEPDSAAQAATFAVTAAEPVPQPVVAWLRGHVHPLRTVAADGGRDEDLLPLAAMVGKARVVGLGEADHGSREFAMLKQRVFELLAARMGFTVVAIEAGWPEALAADEYVVHGKGDPVAALARLSFAYDTPEVLELVRWMRAYNADPGHRRKLRFLGFDGQTAGLASQVLAAYLRQVDPAWGQEMAARLAAVPDDPRRSSAEQRAAARSTIRTVLARLDAQQAAYRSAAGAEEWEQARHDAAIVEQALGLADTSGPASRERAMADNIAWILAHQPAGTRMVVWAHNGHVSHQPAGDGEQPMGVHLRQTLGAGYLSFGLISDHGCFQALRAVGPERQVPWQVPFGPSPVGSLANALHRTGIRLSLLDLRQRPATGRVAEWLAAPHLVHEAGVFYLAGMDFYSSRPVAQRFDGLLYVDGTSATSPIPPP